jgi:hypothetical protein
MMMWLTFASLLCATFGSGVYTSVKVKDMSTVILSIGTDSTGLVQDAVLTLDQFDGITWRVASEPVKTEQGATLELTTADGCFHRLGLAIATYGGDGGAWMAFSGFDYKHGYLGPDEELDEQRMTVQEAISHCR